MKLKCIGGENDGKYFDNNRNYLKNSDLVRMPIYPKEISLMNDPYDEPPKNLTIEYETYRVVSIVSDGEEFKFLIPVQWSTMRAVKHQFGK